MGKMGKTVNKVAQALGHQTFFNFDIKTIDVVIDFTDPSLINETANVLSIAPTPWVLGTTGWKKGKVLAMVRDKGIPLLYGPNFSIGMSLFSYLIKLGTLLTKDVYDRVGLEIHHSEKKDAPSGTALQLMEEIPTLPFTSIRSGHHIGTHQVIFDSLEDTIEMTHRAKNREGFAKGAILGAKWLIGKKGIYTFNDFVTERFICHFEGLITALITPFKEGKLDEQGLRENIRFQIKRGVDALLILGTTGEGGTLMVEEEIRVIEIAVEEKKVPIIVNAGDLSTMRAIEKVKRGQAMGADGFLIIAPYYNCPSQEGIALHFEKIARETSLPIIVYNHPKRTGVHLSLELLIRLSMQKNIIGIKEASGSVSYAATIRYHLPQFLLFAGDDLLSLPLLAIGAKGLISVLSNLTPWAMGEMVRKQDQQLYADLFPLMDVAQIETNPVPIKTMMALAHLPAGEPRLPLTLVTKEHRKQIETVCHASIFFS